MFLARWFPMIFDVLHFLLFSLNDTSERIVVVPTITRLYIRPGFAE